MADNSTQIDPDGYYGEDEVDNEEIDLSFLDESKDTDGEHEED